MRSCISPIAAHRAGTLTRTGTPHRSILTKRQPFQTAVRTAHLDVGWVAEA
jgi:hypothetical protein